MKRIVLFASGSGTNVENIARYFQGNEKVTLACVFSNKRQAKVLERCNNLNISYLCFNKQAFYNTTCVLDALKGLKPDLIVLAGFLLKIPENLVQEFPNKIINIHPALLPKYGGKGMYGMHVHQAVKDNNEEETGITIHYVNEKYDDGAIIKQFTTKILPQDSAETIAQKVHQLEYEHFPETISNLLL
ncbi:phosphoribosylglycinamide formyltransferase [Spongiimicrobium sp. 3-5]|uniref:phosphoribosylglycinamide formyltransferase n=1 Tax=Spongiimicrobium sp. 3-5 TaxID=3332596 RepID=UPI003980125C